METLRCAGYVRVSSKEQIDGESLTTQRKSISDFAALNNYKLTEIYTDAGISGGSMKERLALLRCLQDGEAGKFSILIVHRLSRFGRNARELLENYEQLKQAGIQLRSISEGIDFSSHYGEAMLGMLAIIAQLERDIIRETMLENRLAKAKRGLVTSGNYPYGRRYDKKTGEFTLWEDKAEIIRKAAQQFLSGHSIREIAKSISMSPSNLIEILKERSGSTWTVKFADTEALIYEVPRILTDDVIEQIRERLKFNKRFNRADIVKPYLLSGFIRCDKCYRLMTGQTMHRNITYSYYQHSADTEKNPACTTFKAVPAEAIERAIMLTIFENIVDVPSFNRAIADSLPDNKMIDHLKEKISLSEKEFKRIIKELEDLIDLALTGTLSKETIQSREKSLLTLKQKTEETIKEDQTKLKSLPDPKTVQAEADKIRQMLMIYYSGKERLAEMTFAEKRELLHWMFDGKDETGRPYGIYVSKAGSGKKALIDYFIYGKMIRGLRTMKEDNINFTNHLDIHNNYKTNGDALKQTNKLNNSYKLQFKVKSKLDRQR
jgi:site-specific DNA recombinase